jgi:hypothetical protein
MCLGQILSDIELAYPTRLPPPKARPSSQLNPPSPSPFPPPPSPPYQRSISLAQLRASPLSPLLPALPTIASALAGGRSLQTEQGVYGTARVVSGNAGGLFCWDRIVEANGGDGDATLHVRRQTHQGSARGTCCCGIRPASCSALPCSCPHPQGLR